MSQKIKKVVIAGGGTSGWCTAVALSRQFGTMLDITLIESAEIGTVGVGEATFPTICSFHQIHGIDEQEFLTATRGSIKLAISFENWARKGERYIHPFGSIGKPNWVGPFYHYWLAARARGYTGSYEELSFERVAARAHKFALTENPKLNYAYHFDAGLYAQFLRKLSEEKGVKRIEGKIVEVKKNPDTGFIKSVVMESGACIEGDLFIDCTGFRGLLIEQTLKTGYEDWSRWLRNDSAVALQTEFSGDIPPYTRAIAHDSGWQWKIPLQHRQGTGHVYSSAYISDEDARNTLLDNLDGDIRVELRLLKFTTGRRKQAWVKNCVAIGLAGGFIEPLESTSIHMIQIGITRLLQLFPFEGCNEHLIRRYNEESRAEYEETRDFIILHFKATEREDTPYWRDCRNMEIPDSLAHRIELFKEAGHLYQKDNQIFRIDSWFNVLMGQRIEPKGYHHAPHVISDQEIFSGLNNIKAKIASAVNQLPSHTDFLKAYCAVKK